MAAGTTTARKTFLQEVEERSGQNLHLCYQCLKCSVGCPICPHMDIKPNAIIRLIQYGEREQVLKSRTTWLCVSCMTCGVRCPNKINMSAVFDTLREMAIEEGYSYESERGVVILHEEFVRSVKMWGRLHEITFFLPYLFQTFEFASNIGSGIALILRGKLPFIPKQIKGIDEIWRLFDKAHKTQGQLEAEKQATGAERPAAPDRKAPANGRKDT